MFSYNLYNATLIIEYILQFIICFTGIYCVDKLLAPRRARWYFIHVCMNAAVTYFAWPDVWFCITNPDKCFGEAQSLTTTLPWMIGTVGHIYHLIAFRDLRIDDYIHHLTMIPFAGLAGILYMRKPGFNFGLFALTGLPGGIDYILLILVKLGYINSLTEKQINVQIQTWLRMPLILFGAVLFYTELFKGHLSYWCLVGIGLSVWNGIFYMNDTSKNYYSKHYRVVEKEINK